MQLYPVTEFKLSKYATHLAETVNTIQSIKAYCASVCEDNKLKGYRPARRALKFYRTIAGIRKRKHHQVKRVKPMTKQILLQLERVIDVTDDKQLTV